MSTRTGAHAYPDEPYYSDEDVERSRSHAIRGWMRWVMGKADEPVYLDDDGMEHYDADLADVQLLREQARHGNGGGGLDEWGAYAPMMERRDPPLRKRWLDRAGWYERRPAGGWTTTRQAEALNLFTTRRAIAHSGLITGQNLMGQSVVRLDPFELYKEGVIDGVNTCNIGDVGTGKSSDMKTSVFRQLILNRQVVVFDKKRQGGRGEYGSIADALGAPSIEFLLDGAGVSLNLLDPAISTDGRHKGGVAGVVPAGQQALLLAVLKDAMDQPITPKMRAAVRRALAIVNERAKAANREPLLVEVAGQLLDPEPGMSTAAYDAVRNGAELSEEILSNLGDGGYFGSRWASRSLEWGVDAGLTLLELIDGELRGLVDRPTSQAVHDALEHPFVHFDISGLPEQGKAVQVVMTTAQTWLSNRLAARSQNRTQTVEVFEEGWSLGDGSTGDTARANMKLSRGLGLSTSSAFHHLSDHPADSPSRALMQEADIVKLYKQGRADDAEAVCDMYHLPPETRDVLMQLGRGQCLVVMKNRDPILMQHMRSSDEIALTNTNDVLEGTTP